MKVLDRVLLVEDLHVPRCLVVTYLLGHRQYREHQEDRIVIVLSILFNPLIY